MGMPKFDGSSDAYWWLIQFCQYLKGIGFQEESLLSFVPLGLDGEAYNWWRSWRENHQKVRFITFEKALLIHFKPEFGKYFQDSVEEEPVAREESEKKEQQPEKEHESVELEKKKEDDGPEIKKNNQEKRKRVKAKQGKSQKWSKQNVDLALKMRGITIRRRRKRAKKDRTWNGSRDNFVLGNRQTRKTEDRVGKPGKKTTVTEGWVLYKPENSLSLTKMPHAAVERPPPEPPDGGLLVGGGAVCEKLSTTKRKERRVAALPCPVCVACEKKQKIGPVSKLQVLGQTVGSMDSIHIMIGPKSINVRFAYSLCPAGYFLPLFNTLSRSGCLSYQQWDPGGNL